jgi:hypothetical protein
MEKDVTTTTTYLVQLQTPGEQLISHLIEAEDITAAFERATVMCSIMRSARLLSVAEYTAAADTRNLIPTSVRI